MTQRSIDFRVTSIRIHKDTYSIFAGVPVDKENGYISNAREIIVVYAKAEKLPIPPLKGQFWKVTGQYVVEKKAYKGFKLNEVSFRNPDDCSVTLPETGEEFIQFIAGEPDFKGIGEVKARELWFKFGPTIYSILEDNEKEKLASLLSPASICALFNGYEKYLNLKYANWLAHHKIPTPVTQRLIKYHNQSSIDAVKENPYLLIAFGMNFEKVDEIAQAVFKVDLNESSRLIAAIECALQLHTKQGHTFAYKSDIFHYVQKLLGSCELAELAFKTAYQKASFVINEKTGTYHSTALLIMERVIAKRFNRLKSEKNEWQSYHEAAIQNALGELPYSLTEEQKSAVKMAINKSISCITGGAGTGKTTVLRTVLKVFAELKYNIKAIALSGRAAMRLHEATGFKTSTIAKFLRSEPLELGMNVVVIDEASMIDLPSMYRIVTHVNPDTRLLFVGDPDQLPPIGPGLILKDIINSKSIPVAQLNIVKRQKGSTGIPEYSQYIRQGKIPPHLSYKNVHFHETALEEISSKCVELYLQAPQSTCILGATYKSPFGGIDEINGLCQSISNPEGKRLEFDHNLQKKFLNLRQGDPVLFTRNNYDAGVQNGTLGVLTSLEQTETHFGTVLLDTDKEISITQALLDSLKLGYAISLHKAQGSQFPRVIIALNESRIIDRFWLYTATTRAEVEVHIVGAEKILENKLAKLTNDRQTFLSQQLGL